MLVRRKQKTIITPVKIMIYTMSIMLKIQINGQKSSFQMSFYAPESE